MKRNIYLTDLFGQIHLPKEKSMAVLIDAAVEIAGSNEFPFDRRQNIVYRLATDGYFVDACHEALKATVVASIACAMFEDTPDFSGVARITQDDPDLEMLFGFLLKENILALGEDKVLDAYVPSEERDYRFTEVAQ